MAKPLLTDDLGERIKPLLPPVKRNPKGGRPRVPDRLALTGILFVARTGTAWELLPPELGCGSGMTCWRRLRDWQVARVWQKVWKALLDELGLADKIDWTKAVVDSSSVRALFGGRKLAPIPPIAAKTGRKGMSSATELAVFHSAVERALGMDRSRTREAAVDHFHSHVIVDTLHMSLEVARSSTACWRD